MNSVFQAYYGFGIDMIFYGKPQKASFDYCEKLLRERARLKGIEISHFYILGDTPESDIKGANNKSEDGRYFMLVRTGLIQGLENHFE
jgi:ribonucleotide monophosphatase NagD (HAD superfamily)